MTYLQKFVAAIVTMVAVYFFVPAPATAVATMFMGMIVGYCWAKHQDTGD